MLFPVFLVVVWQWGESRWKGGEGEKGGLSKSLSDGNDRVHALANFPCAPSWPNSALSQQLLRQKKRGRESRWVG